MLDPDISTADALRHLSVAENDPLALDRRRFLQLIGMGVGAGALAGPGSTLLDMTLPGLDPSAWAAGPAGPNGGVLIVLGMFGGNDGLNTVVPIDDGHYYTQHGSLAVAPGATLHLDAQTGLHPHLTEFKRFWDAGQLAVVEGIGYPEADLSHFSSMAKWMAGAPTGVPTSGWLGRWLDGYLNGAKNLYAAAEIGQSVPLHLVGHRHRGTAVPAGRPSFGADTDPRYQKVYASMRRLGVGDPATWSGRLGEAMIDQLDVAAKIAPLMPKPEDLSRTELVARMEVMARLVNANLGFRVLTAGWGDFDSHAGQPSQHPVRMQELNAAIKRFFEVLSPVWASRVTIMTFSEFGRTSYSNDGMGTDHGTAAPHFVLGANVRGGRYGQRPSLAGLRRWDRMPYHVDFRDYYGSVVDGWLGGGASEIFAGRAVQNLGLFAAAPGTGGAVAGAALGEFVPLSPARVYDTRDGTGGRSKKIGPGETIHVQIADRGGVPVSGALAVALNVTSVNASHDTNFRVFPSGIPVPTASSLNPRAGRAVPNMTVVGVGAGGKVSVFNQHGSADCVVDVMGFYRGETSSKMMPLVPARLLDTRDGTGAPAARVRGGSTIDLQVAGRGGVPASGVQAVVLNVGSVNPTARGFVTVWPTSEPRPSISNLNYTPGMNIPNLVMCKLGSGGKVSLFANEGELDLIADVVGCYSAEGGARLVSVTPRRVLDTRDGTGARRGPVNGGSEIDVAVTGTGGVSHEATAVIINVTAVNATSDTYVTVYPNGVGRPGASSLNVKAGNTVANLVIAKVGTGGRVRLYNHRGAVDLLADITGYFV
jgi:uncharacterized protein (DUF1501 family)